MSEQSSTFIPSHAERHTCPLCGHYVGDLTKPDWYCEGCGLSYYGEEEMASWVARFDVLQKLPQVEAT